jgi:hypothetical protein
MGRKWTTLLFLVIGAITGTVVGAIQMTGELPV